MPTWRGRVSAEKLVAWAVMAATTVFVLWQLYPSLIFWDTTPVQGDLGGHVHEPAHLRDHLLPDFRLSGWSQDWFTGYPSLTYYFPLSALLVVLLDLVLPYNVALKLLSAVGPVALPLCAYAFGRLSGRDRLTSTCLGISVLPLLLLTTLNIAGGSIAASTGGEYAFQLSLAVGLLVLGVVRGGLHTGRRRVAAALLLAAMFLLHIVPTVIVLAGLAISVALRPAWASLGRIASVVAVGAALAGFYAVPAFLWSRYTAGPDYPPSGPITEWLFPREILPVVLLAVLGVVATFVRDPHEDAEPRDDHGIFLIAVTVASGLAFAFTPTGRVWNGRFLGVWFLWLCLLAGNEVARLARAFDRSRHRRAQGEPRRLPALVRLVMPVVMLAVVVLLWDSRSSPGLLTAVRTDTRTPERAYQGYERNRDSDMNQAFIDDVRALGRDHGCGRAHVEWTIDGWTDTRLPLTWLVPYWTKGCVTSTYGIYTQSSATFPYVDAANSRLTPEPRVFGPERSFDFDAGLADLRLLGVRYLIASGDETMRAADASPVLRPLPRPVDRPWPWRFYEFVDESALAEPLRHMPVVVPGMGDSRSTWEPAAGRWFDRGRDREVVLAADGPKAWPRRSRASGALPRRALPPATVSRVRMSQDRVSFDVSRTGVPVLVKVSYFPNWKVSGADGPWRVTPNQMVVVPTAKSVTLHYGRTPVDHGGWLVTLLGLAGLVVLGRRESLLKLRRGE